MVVVVAAAGRVLGAQGVDNGGDVARYGGRVDEGLDVGAGGGGAFVGEELGDGVSDADVVEVLARWVRCCRGCVGGRNGWCGKRGSGRLGGSC
jgi:hypothetical protein